MTDETPAVYTRCPRCELLVLVGRWHPCKQSPAAGAWDQHRDLDEESE